MTSQNISPALAERTAQRRAAVAADLKSRDVPALLIANLQNIRYLTGFSGSNALLLLRADGSSVLGTDGRYDTQVRLQTGSPSDVEIVVDNDLYGMATHRAGAAGFHIEPTLPVGVAEKLGNPTTTRGVVEARRKIKDDIEIAALREAGRLADTVWQEFIAAGGIREGITEIAAAADLEYRLRTAGADSLSFDTILASGVRGAKPHAGVSKEKIVPGLVTVDFGVYVDGYASDQTRTVCVGQPDELASELYRTVQEAQLAGEAVVTAGAKLYDVDKASRDVIEAAGYGEYFVHSTGHGVGLDVHEAPAATSRAAEDDVLAAGMTLTVEPGIYLPGKTGIRIENTYIVTDAKPISCNPSSRDMIIV